MEWTALAVAVATSAPSWTFILYTVKRISDLERAVTRVETKIECGIHE